MNTIKKIISYITTILLITANINCAQLYFYYSSMNAGKTSNLIQNNYNYKERGMQTLCFKPKVDTRFGDMIVARTGLKLKAILITKDFDLFKYITNYLKTATCDCVLVDEAQFLTKEQVNQLALVVDKLNIPVIAYGLRTDFKSNLFPGSELLLAIADKLKEVKALCFCGRKSILNLRVNNKGQCITEGAQIEIGGNELYIAVCRKHYHKATVENVPIKVSKKHI